MNGPMPAARPKRDVKHFRRWNEVQERAKAAANVMAVARTADEKIAAQKLVDEAEQRVRAYTSRGKGRGTASKKFGNESHNTQHQGAKEMARRRRQMQRNDR